MQTLIKIKGFFENMHQARYVLTSGNILKTSVVIGRIPLVSTSYLSLVPAGVFLLVVNKKEGALQQRDRDILQEDSEERQELVSS